MLKQVSLVEKFRRLPLDELEVEVFEDEVRRWVDSLLQTKEQHPMKMFLANTIPIFIRYKFSRSTRVYFKIRKNN